MEGGYVTRPYRHHRTISLGRVLRNTTALLANKTLSNDVHMIFIRISRSDHHGPRQFLRIISFSEGKNKGRRQENNSHRRLGGAFRPPVFALFQLSVAQPGQPGPRFHRAVKGGIDSKMPDLSLNRLVRLGCGTRLRTEAIPAANRSNYQGHPIY